MSLHERDRPYPSLQNEAERLIALVDLEFVGGEFGPEVDAIVELACDLFSTPYGAVALRDENRQGFKSSRALGALSTERTLAFCNQTVASGEMFVVEDTQADVSAQRSARGEPSIRFFAGVPVSTEPGVAMGALCVIDVKPRGFTKEEAGQLRRMGDVVSILLRQRSDAGRLIQLASELEAQRRANTALAESLSRTKHIFDRASALTKMGAWEWRLDTGELIWTDGMYDIHEAPKGSPITPEQVLQFYPKGARERVRRTNANSNAERHYVLEAPLVTAKGNKRWVRLTGSAEQEDGVIVRRFGVKQDITEQKIARDRLQFLAERDPLTGLVNRSQFHQRLQQPFFSRIGARPFVALLLVDVDRFKHLNETFGHAAGDECLKKIAKRLLSGCPKAELVARLGGDEFALLMTTSDFDEPTECARRLLASIRQPVRWHGESFQLSASIGITIFAKGASDRQPADLFGEADLALQAAKAAGRNMFRSFTPGLKRDAHSRIEAVQNIAKALDQRQLELFYQPKVDLSRGAELAGFEGLLRWRRPDGRIVTAGEFAAALEDPALSERIGDWVIGAALRQAQAWSVAGLDFRHIAINLSSAQFRDPSFAGEFIEQVARHGLRPEMIQVEVTEGVFLNHEAGNVRAILQTFRSAGIRIALDDFGTGYASLTHLRTYPVDILKIDRSFVRHCLTSYQDSAILQSTLFLARLLKLDVVAEGIERTDQCEFLVGLGCRYGQGYLFAKALCAPEAARWGLARHKNMFGQF